MEAETSAPCAPEAESSANDSSIVTKSGAPVAPTVQVKEQFVTLTLPLVSLADPDATYESSKPI